MNWYILKYMCSGKKCAIRIRAYSFGKAVECAKQYAGEENILSVTAANAVKA